MFKSSKFIISAQYVRASSSVVYQIITKSKFFTDGFHPEIKFSNHSAGKNFLGIRESTWIIRVCIIQKVLPWTCITGAQQEDKSERWKTKDVRIALAEERTLIKDHILQTVLQYLYNNHG